MTCFSILFFKNVFLCRQRLDCVFLSKPSADTALGCVRKVPFAPANFDDFLPKVMLPMRCH